jgi:peptide/nickel transport system permease protein
MYSITDLKVVFLPTDIMLYLFLFGLCYSILYIQKDSQLKETWKTILSNKLYNACFIVLMVFFAISILDSIHFRPILKDNNNTHTIFYSSKVASALDSILQQNTDETSYSMPFATHNLNKTYGVNDAGEHLSFYGPLKIIKSTPEYNKTQMLVSLSNHIIMLALIFLFYQFIKNKAIALGHCTYLNTAAFRYAFNTIFIVALIFSALITISHYYHIFGTNKVGQDVFYEAIKSIRTGIVIGTVTTMFTLPLAIILGICAGYFGNKVDDIIQFVYTTISAIPGILLISAAILSLQIWLEHHADWFNTLAESSDIRLLMICFILGCTHWTSLCRLLRGETLKVREMDFVTAAKTLGVSKTSILFKHILPNITHIILIITAIDFSSLVLAEAVLSYIGVGVSATTSSWGNMINSARLELAREPAIWWPLLAAFIFMFILVLTANIFADGVREAFDPRAKNSKA